MIIITDTEEHIYQNSISIPDKKALRVPRVEGNFINPVQDIHKKMYS